MMLSYRSRWHTGEPRLIIWCAFSSTWSLVWYSPRHTRTTRLELLELQRRPILKWSWIMVTLGQHGCWRDFQVRGYLCDGVVLRCCEHANGNASDHGWKTSLLSRTTIRDVQCRSVYSHNNAHRDPLSHPLFSLLYPPLLLHRGISGKLHQLMKVQCA